MLLSSTPPFYCSISISQTTEKTRTHCYVLLHDLPMFTTANPSHSMTTRSRSGAAKAPTPFAYDPYADGSSSGDEDDEPVNQPTLAAPVANEAEVARWWAEVAGESDKPEWSPYTDPPSTSTTPTLVVPTHQSDEDEVAPQTSPLYTGPPNASGLREMQLVSEVRVDAAGISNAHYWLNQWHQERLAIFQGLHTPAAAARVAQLDNLVWGAQRHVHAASGAMAAKCTELCGLVETHHHTKVPYCNVRK